ncbi:hypothetical protein GW932_02050 [archaeon]|nr:hypothetical protein [archaeon]
MPQRRPSVDEVLRKYGAKIEGQVRTSNVNTQEFSQSYEKFKGEMTRQYSGYEKWCHTLGNIIRLKPSKKDEDRIKKAIDGAHLDVEPWQAIGLGVMAFISLFMLGLLISVAIALVKGDFAEFPLLFFFLVVIFSMFIFYFSQSYPERLAKLWRLKASSQMVPAILYIVVYMRHTPNLEKAIAFAAEHLEPPLSLDFRKIFYDVEVGKYSTIKDSLEIYLESWRGFSTEFIEGFHLIESSLFEPEEGRRIATLEKALQVVLDGVYDKMLNFSHEVKAPLTNVYMLGVVMPTLGLALIPLASAMVGGMLNYVHVFVLFNLIIPFLVYFLTDKILLLRPGGHGNSSFLERNPLYPKFVSKEPFKKAFLIALPFILISLIPLIFHYTPLPEMMGLQKDYTFNQLGLGFLGRDEMFFGFIDTLDGTKGPFGLGAVLLGMMFPIGIALFFVTAYREKTKDLILERNKTKELEKEFNNSLFQIGNRLGNGVPPELVFSRVAESTKGLRTGEFFSRVNYNIQQLGMSVEAAVFDKDRGTIRFFPSQLIATSMRVLIESSKKGLKIAAVSLMSISEYIKNINKITVRLKDLLAEVTSDMKSNMTFLAPLLSGIVVGLASMITSILGKLQVGDLAAGGADLGGIGDIVNIFDYQSMIPPYFLQISVGIYLIQIIFILTSALVTIDEGEDKLEQRSQAAEYLKKGIGMFFVTALIATVTLSVLGTVVLGNLF